MRRVSLAGLALVGALLLAIPSAFAKSDAAAADPGISARTITIGGTFPLTGPASSYAPIPAAMKAYFSYINSRKGPDGKRGVFGRQIVFKYYDDGYNPVNSVQLQRKLVQEDKVFAVVGTLGTEVNQAVQPYLNSSEGAARPRLHRRERVGHELQEVPLDDRLAAGLHRRGPPLRPGHPPQPPEREDRGPVPERQLREGLPGRLQVGARHRERAAPDRRRGGLGGRQRRASVAADQAPGERCGHAVIFVTPTPTIQTYAVISRLGWKPDNIYVNSVSATDTFMTIAVASSSAATVNGSISAAYLKDPASPVWDNDATVKQYKTLMAKYNPRGRVTDGLNFYGFAKAHTFVRAMYKAGRNPTRAGPDAGAPLVRRDEPVRAPGRRG